MEEIVNRIVEWIGLDSSLGKWILALIIGLVTLAVLWVIKRVLVAKLKSLTSRTRTQADDFMVKVAASTNLLFILTLAVYTGSLALSLSPEAADIVLQFVKIVLFIQVGLWASTLIGALVQRKVQDRLADESGSAVTLNVIGIVAKGAAWTLVVLLILDNLGVQVTTLVASLGIGGIAIGLAVQNILADLFASLSIALDKPFTIGDYITVGEFSGNVEHVGLKSTRIRSLSGEQLIFSNSDLLNSRIRNYKRMERRRVVFTIGVTYDTPAEKLREIPALIREIVTRQAMVAFDRSHLTSFGPSAINFETVYILETSDYQVYMDVQQEINLALYECFTGQDIQFAYPTQTVYLQPMKDGVTVSRDQRSSHAAGEQS